MEKSILAKNIKKLRHFKNLNQTDFAELFGINRSNIGSYEESRAEPKLEVLIKIASYFKLTLDQLVRKELTVNEIAGFKLPSEEKGEIKKLNEKMDELNKMILDIQKKVAVKK
ncbi:MAG: helix-turn-helix domain-containing protein [Flavobacteriales bacterium]|nr:helix-turn-helix domain-containing protein [Flavobacteriales bacterium]